MKIRSRGITACATIIFPIALSGCLAPQDNISLADSSSGQWISPLEEVMRPLRDPEEVRRVLMAQHSWEQEFIAACMLEAGFSYIPDPGALFLAGGTADNEAEFLPDDRVWVNQYGYGEVSGHTSFTTIWEQRFGPNDEIVASLSDSERLTYDVALHGPIEYRFPPGIVELYGSELLTALENQGCAGRARASTQVNSPLSIMDSEEFRPLQEAIWQFYETVQDNPEAAIIDTDWVFCMSDAGHPSFARQRDPQNQIAEEWRNLSFRMHSSGNNPAILYEMQELKRLEIELALADLDCREAVSYWERINAVRYREEIRFIEDHQAAFNALQDALEQRGVPQS